MSFDNMTGSDRSSDSPESMTCPFMSPGLSLHYSKENSKLMFVPETSSRALSGRVFTEET